MCTSHSLVMAFPRSRWAIMQVSPQFLQTQLPGLPNSAKGLLPCQMDLSLEPSKELPNDLSAGGEQFRILSQLKNFASPPYACTPQRVRLGRTWDHAVVSQVHDAARTYVVTTPEANPIAEIKVSSTSPQTCRLHPRWWTHTQVVDLRKVLHVPWLPKSRLSRCLWSSLAISLWSSRRSRLQIPRLLGAVIGCTVHQSGIRIMSLVQNKWSSLCGND